MFGGSGLPGDCRVFALCSVVLALDIVERAGIISVCFRGIFLLLLKQNASDLYVTGVSYQIFVPVSVG